MSQSIPSANNDFNGSQLTSQSCMIFLVLTTVYLFAWTISPAWINTSVALDVSEGINWGSEWQWGYYKHPPLSSWVLYVFYLALGETGAYVLSQLCVMASLFFTYQLGKQVWARERAMLGALLSMGIFYYTYPTLEFNHNIAQFPIWSGLALHFYLTLTQGKWSHWIGLGVLGGLGMLTKYSVIFLLLPLALFLLLPAQWRWLKTPKPWLALALMVLIFAPHFYWLMTHDWLTLSYAQGRGQATSFWQAHFNWLGFMGAQLAVHVPLLIIAIWHRKQLMSVSDYRQQLSASQRLIWMMYVAPVALVISLSLVFGIKLKDMWGMPMWGMSGLLLASFIRAERLSETVAKMLKGVGIWLVIGTLLMLTYLTWGHTLRNRPSRMDWNAQALTHNAQQTWQRYSSCQLDSLSGDRWLTALVAMRSGFPSQVFEGNPNKTPWMNAERLQKHGTLVVWQAKKQAPNLPLLDSLAPETFAHFEGQWSIPWHKNTEAKPLLVNWRVYVPKACRS